MITVAFIAKLFHLTFHSNREQISPFLFQNNYIHEFIMYHQQFWY